jgi:hypothetical protein
MKHINPAQDKLNHFRSAMETTPAGRGWAWEIQMIDGSWVLCNWAEPNKSWNMARYSEMDGKPSPEARRVYVAIVPMREYRKLLKAK